MLLTRKSHVDGAEIVLLSPRLQALETDLEVKARCKLNHFVL